MLRAPDSRGRTIAGFLLTTLIVVSAVLCNLAAFPIMSAQVARSGPAEATRTTPTLAVGAERSLLVRSDGTLWAWGSNLLGQLGLGDSGPGTERHVPTQVGSATDWVGVAGGGHHSVGLRSDGTLWAWGYNSTGELGLGDTTNRSSPTQVGTATEWVAVSAGGTHCLGLRSDGSLWAWGNNSSGQLGLGDNASRLEPTQVGSATDWVAVSTGGGHSLGLRSDGTLWVWGFNLFGELGLGDTANRTSPTQVGSATDWVEVSGGQNHSLGLRSDGTLWAWGYNYDGWLGLGDREDRLVPTRVGNASDWVSVGSGWHHSVGLRSNGTLWAWGQNDTGQLGLGDTANRLIPTQVGSATDWVAVAGGYSHVLGFRSDGTLWAWGWNNRGELGLGDTTDRHDPTQVNLTLALPISVDTLPPTGISENAATLNGEVTALGNAEGVAVSAGGHHSLLICCDGTLWAWGYNRVGQLGLSDNVNRLNPTQVGGDTNWVAVASGGLHSLGLRSDGTLWAWGSNQAGQLGLGDSADRWSPTQVGSTTNWVAVCAAGHHSLGVRSDGTLWAWGSNGDGELGLGDTTNRLAPTRVGGNTNWVAVSSGGSHSLGLRSDGTLWAWGDGEFGQLGVGNTTDRLTPTQVDRETNWVAVSAGAMHSLGLRSDGTLWSWGYNAAGELGLGDSTWGTQRSAPTQAGTDSNWVAVCAGGNYSLGLRSDGTLWSWGWNGNGALGLGDTANRLSSPTQVGSATSWSTLSGSSHSLGLRSDGSLLSWGWNGYGQLGLADTTFRTSPTQVGLACHVSFEWGLTTSYGNETASQTVTVTSAFSDDITGLNAGVTYHFRAKVVGIGTAYGSDMMVIPQSLPVDRPVVTSVAARHDGDQSSAVIGTFISGIEVYNAITAQAFGPNGSGDVTRVTFTLDGQAPVDGARGAQGWTMQQNMGNLAPGTENLSVVAYDGAGLASTPYVVTVVMIDRPDWLKKDDPHVLETSAIWDATDQKYALTATIPDPAIEYGKQFSDVPYCQVLNNYFKAGFTVGADYWIDPSERPPLFTSSGTLEAQILNQDVTPGSFNITGALNPDLSFTSMEVPIKEFNIYERNVHLIKPIRIGPTGPLGLAFNLRVDLFLQAKVDVTGTINDDLTVESFTIRPAIDCGGILDASVEALWGFARAGVEAKAAVEMAMPVTYSFYEDPNLQAEFSLDIYVDYRVYVSIFWGLWQKDLLAGRYDVYSSGTQLETQALPTTSVSDNDTYLFSSPRIATDNSGRAMLVWIHDKNEGLAVPDPEVYYRVWNGTSWGQPAAITNNDRFETDPVVAYESDGGALAIWTQNRLTQTEAEPLGDDFSEILSNQEIYYSRWDGSAWSVPLPVTDNDRPDGLASIAALPNGQALAAWVYDGDGDAITNNDWEIHYSVWDGSSWSTPASMTNNTAADLAVDLASDPAGNAMAVWLHDEDGDFDGTLGDQGIHYSFWNGDGWTAPAAAATNAEKAVSPSVASRTESNAVIAWVGGTDAHNKLYASLWDRNSNSWSASELITESDQFIHDPVVNVDSNNHLAVLWRGPGGNNGEIFYSVKDLGQAGSQWTEPRPLKGDDEMHWMPTAAMDSHGQVLEVDSMTVAGSSSTSLKAQSLESSAIALEDGLSFSLVSIGLDLALSESDITFSNPTPSAGESVTISAALHYIGGYEARDAVISFFDGDPDTGGTQIGLGQIIPITVGGAEQSGSVQWTASSGHHNIYVIVDHSNAIAELDEANNRASRTIDVDVVPGEDDVSPASPVGSAKRWLIGSIIGGVVVVGGVAGGIIAYRRRNKQLPG